MEAPKFELKTEGKDTLLVITCTLPKKGEPSASGKTLLVASTRGNLKTGLKFGGDEIVVGMNAYTKK